MSLALERWRWRSILTLSLSFSYHLLSLFIEFHLRHTEDGADFHIFNLSLSFSYYLLSLFITEFHLRHTEDGADFHIFILSLSFSYYLLSLSNSLARVSWMNCRIIRIYLIYNRFIYIILLLNYTFFKYLK